MKGGRMQALALAAALRLEEHARDSDDYAWRITVLAAGTDGRDGPSGAAGAMVNETSWATSARSGGDPARSLRRCDAFGALSAADAILPARETGTNVMDIVVAIRR